MVTTLQDDLARREHHIKELENTLNCSNKDDLVVKVNELNMKFDRSMQDFSEKLTKIVDQVVASPHMVHGGKDIADGQAADENNIVSGVNDCRTLLSCISTKICLVSRTGSGNSWKQSFTCQLCC